MPGDDVDDYELYDRERGEDGAERTDNAPGRRIALDATPRQVRAASPAHVCIAAHSVRSLNARAPTWVQLGLSQGGFVIVYFVPKAAAAAAQLTCAICAEDKPKAAFSVMCGGLWDSTRADGGGWAYGPCTPGAAHGDVCTECSHAHVRAELSSKGMTSTIACPAKGTDAAPTCTGTMCAEDMVRLGVPAQHREKFERNVLHAAMDQHPRFRWCTKPGVRTRRPRWLGHYARDSCFRHAVRQRLAVRGVCRVCAHALQQVRCLVMLRLPLRVARGHHVRAAHADDKRRK
jgi:hypothetical protein